MYWMVASFCFLPLSLPQVFYTDDFLKSRQFETERDQIGRLRTATKLQVLYCIVSIHLYSVSCSEHQSEALPVRETHDGQVDIADIERWQRKASG